MRFDTPITFYTDPSNKYNPETGQHDSTPTEVFKCWANVTDNGVQRNVETFGNYNIQTKTIRLVESINFNWSFLLIGNDTQHWIKKTKTSTSKVKSFQVGIS
ncbi:MULTISPECIES: hypothetical protein [Companilactobacillus]|uniref:Uncharacterized protein n=1 Tax=Companilactobacillus ginsenosidimutans TaxID=1007676 RepID=A0A0H4QDW5_9LACO|nr:MULTISPECIES: hypothetical protein [Companilactobacillus]AKP66101.1 hypothetical protein ABM34_00010 [Companilactobacillus ginsenosidimutans]AKP66137.1 hypothetical protein ABM34_00250 [Companilactobacillus ginsenosidimutans]